MRDDDDGDDVCQISERGEAMYRAGSPGAVCESGCPGGDQTGAHTLPRRVPVGGAGGHPGPDRGGAEGDL